jgi:hypothetical protein
LVAFQDWQVVALRAQPKTTLEVLLFTSKKKSVIDTYPTGSEHHGEATAKFMELYMQDTGDWSDDANVDRKSSGFYCTYDAGQCPHARRIIVLAIVCLLI